MNKLQADLLITGFVDEDFQTLEKLYDYCLDIGDEKLLIKIMNLDINEETVNEAYDILYKEELNKIQQFNKKKFANYVSNIKDKHLLKYLKKNLIYNPDHVLIISILEMTEEKRSEFIGKIRFVHLNNAFTENWTNKRCMESIHKICEFCCEMCRVLNDSEMYKKWSELKRKVKRFS